MHAPAPTLSMLASAIALAVAGVAHAAQSTAERRLAPGDGAPAFVELVPPRAWIYAGEETNLRVRVGVATDVREALVQPFARQLDVPLQVHVPWPSALSAPPLDDAERSADAAHATLVLDDALVRARRMPDEERAGRSFVVLELERPLAAAEAQRLVFPSPSVRLVMAKSYERDALDQRVPTELETLVVTGAALELDVRALPEHGRPAGFGGAVGEIELEAAVSPSDLALGESARLVLRVAGRANFARLEPPELDRWNGIRQLGRLVERDSGGLRVTYDLRPESDAVREVPAVELPYFDPRGEGAYRIASTRPIPIRVRAAATTANEIGSSASDGGAGAARESSSATHVTWIVALVAAALVACGAALWRRRALRRRA